MSEVLFIRHGYTPSNNANYNEQTGIRDIIKFDELCPLEKNYGMKQSEELGEFLGNHLKDKKVLWIMSPYVRAKETSIIASQNLVNSGANINFMVDNSLREINQGLVYGINYREKNEQISEYVDEIYYQSLGTDKEIAIPNPGGESELDVRRRVKSFADEVKYIKTVSDYNAIVILSHGTVNKWVYYWLNNKQAAPKQVTCGVFNDAGQVLFEPATFVPKGYYVDLKEYEETPYNKALIDICNMFGSDPNINNTIIQMWSRITQNKDKDTINFKEILSNINNHGKRGKK